MTTTGTVTRSGSQETINSSSDVTFTGSSVFFRIGSVSSGGSGTNAAGSLTVNNGSTFTIDGGTSGGSPHLNIGGGDGSFSTVTVTGSGSRIITSGTFTSSGSFGTFTSETSRIAVGEESGSKGRLVVENGGFAQTNRLTVGNSAASDGRVLVTGSGSRLTTQGTSNSIDVGNAGNGTGTLDITQGGRVDGFRMVVGYPGTGTVNVTGSGSTLILTPDNGRFSGSSSTVASSLTIGGSSTSYSPGLPTTTFNGQGTVNVSDGGTLEIRGNADTAQPSLKIGSGDGSTGSVTVDGSGSSLSVIQTRTFPEVFDSSGNLTTSSQDTAFATVGSSGQGSLTVRNGGTVTVDGGPGAATMRVGNNLGSVGTVTVDGGTINIRGTSVNSVDFDSTLPNNADRYRNEVDLRIGRRGTGSVTVSNGGTLNVDGGSTEATIVLGRDFTTNADSTVTRSSGTLTVSGTGSTVKLTGGADKTFVEVGRHGTGILNISDGGSLTVSGPSSGSVVGVFVGTRSDGTGTVAVDGTGSLLDAGNRLAIGLDTDLKDAGTGTLTVTNGGTAQATSIFIGSRGTLKGNGTVIGSVFNRGGMVSAGTSPGTLTIQGNFTQTSGTLLTEIASASSFDQLAVSGSASITGGTIAFSFLDGFTPAPGDDFKFIDADGGVTISSGVAASFSGLPEGFGTGEFERLFIDGGRLSYITTASVQEDAVEAVGQTQTRTTSNVITRSILSRIRSVGADFARLETAGSPSQTGLAGGSVPEGLGFWLDGTYSRIQSDRTQESFEGNTYIGLLGTDYRVTDDLLVGAAFGIEFGDTDLVSAQGDLDTQGYSGTLYAAYRLTDAITVSVLGGYAGTGNDIREARFGTRVTGEYDSQRLLGGTSLSYFHGIDSWEFLADVGFTYAHEWYDPYTASNGARVTPANNRVGTLRGGLEVAKTFDFATPFLTISVDHDFITSREFDSVGERVDNSGLIAGGGFRVPVNDWIEGGVLTTIEVGRSQEQSYSVNASLRLQF